MSNETFVTGYRPVNANVASPSNEDNRQDNQLATGIYEGGFITINGSDPTKIDISAGSGVVVDNYTDPEVSEVFKIQWIAKTGVPVTYLESDFTSYIGLARNAEVVQFATDPTAEQKRDYIILGLVVHTGGTVVESVSNQVQIGYDQANGLLDLSAAVGIVNIDGNVFSANSANLKLNRSAGKSFKLGGNYYNNHKSPNVIDLDALTQPYLYKPYRDGSGNFSIVFPLTQSLDPSKYDDNSGTLATIPANTPWQVLRIYHNPVNTDVIVHYAQTLYQNEEAAEASIGGDAFTPNPVLKDSLLRCFLVIKRDCTSLQDTTKCKFIAADKFGITKATGATSNVPTIQSVFAASESVGDTVIPVLSAFTLQDNNDDPTSILLGVHPYNSSTDVFQISANGRLNLAKITSNTTANRPAGPTIGQLYFDTTLGKPIWYLGSNWVDAAGSTV